MITADDFRENFFPLTDRKGIDKRRHRFRIEGRVASRNDQRTVFIPFCRKYRHSGKIDECQYIGIQAFIRDRDANDVHVTELGFAFQRIKRNSVRTHLRFHIFPGKVNSFSPDVRHFVQLIIKNRKTKIGYTKIINVGKCQCDAGFNLCGIFHYSIIFTTDVASRFLYFQQKSIYIFFDFVRLHLHIQLILLWNLMGSSIYYMFILSIRSSETRTTLFWGSEKCFQINI